MLHVIGDIILDSYYLGTTDRISPEAPVPIVNVNETFHRLGGGGNVATIIANLGSAVKIWTSFGTDEAGHEIEKRLQLSGIDFHNFGNSKATTQKSRVISRNQNIVRFDHESTCKELSDQQRHTIFSELKKGDQLILSDYGKGLIGDMSKFLHGCKTKGVQTFVDPKSHDFKKYNNCYLIKPNLNELTLATLQLRNAEEKTKIQSVLEQTGASYCLLTKSEDGMSLTDTAGNCISISGMAKEVLDVTGAGDSVIASLCVALDKGKNLPEALEFSNLIAAYSVRKLGCAVIEIDELNSFLKSEGAEQWTT